MAETKRDRQERTIERAKESETGRERKMRVRLLEKKIDTNSEENRQGKLE